MVICCRQVTLSFVGGIVQIGDNDAAIRLTNLSNLKYHAITSYVKYIFHSGKVFAEIIYLKMKGFAASLIQRKFSCFSKNLQDKSMTFAAEQQVLNPFKHIYCIHQIVEDAFKQTQYLYHPTKERCGMPLSEFMRRLGLYQDIYPLMISKGIVSTEQLYKLSNVDLVNIGIDEHVRGSLREGVLDAEGVRRNKLD